MRRGAKPGKAKVEARLSVARKSPKNETSGRPELEKRLAESLEREKATDEILQEKNRALTEAFEQQTATAEILRVISSSPTDVQPVFDTVAEHAMRLCRALHGVVLRFDGELIHLAALANASPEGGDALQRAFPTPPGRHTAASRAILTGATIHIPDVQSDSDYALAGEAQTAGYRSIVSVPMLRDGRAIGTLNVHGAEVGQFSERQVRLLQTFADQAVIAIENVRLFNETKEALEQQTATIEILRVISSSPTDLQPVFDAILDKATELCDANLGALGRYDGERYEHLAHRGASPEFQRYLFNGPRVMGASTGVGRMISTRRPVHIPDIKDEPAYRSGDPARVATADLAGARTFLAVPMLKEGRVVGGIIIYRVEVRPFGEKQIELVTTFANQAVIAIENVRLFTELQQKNEALTQAHAQVSETLEQQTATSEILQVISQSPTEAQPVFETIVRNAVRLCSAVQGGVYRFDGQLVHSVAHDGYGPEELGAWRKTWPRPATAASVACLAIRTKSLVRISDIETAPELSDSSPEARANLRARGIRSVVSVPMRRQDDVIGAISLAHRQVDGFSDAHVELLRTFADQAVIAIENVRLFTELGARNRDLTESLDRQTATAEILRVISRSPTDVRPVFEAIADAVARLFRPWSLGVYRFDGEVVDLVASRGGLPGSEHRFRELSSGGIRPTRDFLPGRAILDRAAVHIVDVETDPTSTPALREFARLRGWRAVLQVPMLRDDEPVGVISITRAEPRPFAPSEIELLKTFADQAVIAVENVRLFKELEARTGELTQSVEKLTALGEVSRAVSSTLDVETVLNTIVSRASQLAGADGCSIFEYDEAAEQFELRATHNDDTEFVQALRAVPLRKGEGLMGRAAEMREPIQIPDITQPGAYESSVRDTLIRFGYRALLAVRLLREDQIIGSLSFNRKAPGEFPPEVVDVLKTFATQSALAIQNARLFREIADKSAQLEAASRHKSEFLANMSHELRTPLNAIIGFSEVLTERMFGELNEKQDEYLKDIHASGQHLLSLINDILDLSKIEAGRMELELSDFDLPNAIENALILVRERASRRGITLGHSIDERLGVIGGDERKVKQVLLNLLSNALKFTPEGGRIDVSAHLRDGVAEVSVADTGVGIAPEDQDAVFEEFRQVGTADKKAEGTGLGLALSRKFIELHGGRIWVKSELGTGSTFTFTLPLTIDQRRP